MGARRPAVPRLWWLVAAVVALGLVVGAAKLSVRSLATGEAVLPGVAGAPVLGPPPTETPVPGPARGRLRVQVVDDAGTPVASAQVEVRDRLGAQAGTQETSSTGDAFFFVSAGSGYAVTARGEGFAPTTISAVTVPPAPTPNPNATPARPVPGGSDGTLVATPRPFAPPVQVRLQRVAPANGPAARLFVGHAALPRITAIDPLGGVVAGQTEPLGQGRQTLQAVSKDGSTIFASWMGNSDLWVIAAADLKTARQVPLNAGPISALATNPQDGTLWVATYQADTTDAGMLLELDPRTLDVRRRINVGQLTSGLRFRPDGTLLYARHRAATALSVLDPRAGTVLKTLRLPQWPSDMALSPDGSTLYLVFLGGDKLVALNAATAEMGRSIDIGSGASSIQAHPDGKRVFVVNQLLGSVQVVDAVQALVTDLIPVGRAPQGATLSGGTLYVADAGSGTVSVVDVDSASVRQTITVGGSPASLILAGAAS